MSVSKYPLDYSKLKPGMWLEIEELEKALDIKHPDPNWKLRVLALRADIEEKVGLLSKLDGDRLRIMEHIEADIWTRKRFKHHLSGIIRSVQRRTLVDRSVMTEVQRREAESWDRITAGTAIAASRRYDKERLEIEATIKK